MDYTNLLYEAVSDSKICEADDTTYLEYIVERINSLYEEDGISARIEGNVIKVKLNNGRIWMDTLKQFCDWFMKYAMEAEDRIEDIGDYSGDFDVAFDSEGLVITPSSVVPRF